MNDSLFILDENDAVERRVGKEDVEAIVREALVAQVDDRNVEVDAC